MWNWLRPQTHATIPSVRIPLTPTEAVAARATFRHVRTWRCACGAYLRIRAREARNDGPSNFTPYPSGHRLAGHSTIPADELTWAGLAEERGWQVDPLQCPACQRGVSVADYRKLKRIGL